jgi:hypothetical protein
MIVRFYDIQWDTNDEEDGKTLDLASLNLPTNCDLSVEDDIDVQENGAEVLSQEYGRPVKGFKFQVEPQTDEEGLEKVKLKFRNF